MTNSGFTFILPDKHERNLNMNKSAEGLEAGKTKIKYKDVEAGTVDAVDLSKDLMALQRLKERLIRQKTDMPRKGDTPKERKMSHSR